MYSEQGHKKRIVPVLRTAQEPEPGTIATSDGETISKTDKGLALCTMRDTCIAMILGTCDRILRQIMPGMSFKEIFNMEDHIIPMMVPWTG